MQTKEIKEKPWSPAPADRTKYPEPGIYTMYQSL
jgi:hypothetical protein